MMRRFILVSLCAVLLLGIAQPVRASQGAGQTVRITLLLQGSSVQEQTQDDECQPTTKVGDPELRFGSQSFALDHGVFVLAKDSPTGRFGCMFELTAKMDGSVSYRVFVGDTKVGTLTESQIANLGYTIEISLGASEETHSGSSWRFPAPPTPAPTPTNTPPPTPIPSPELGPIPGKDTYLLGGTFVLFGTAGDEFFITQGGCFGRGGYNDIGVGTQVIIRDETNSIISSGEFEPDPNAKRDQCKFVFYIEVPSAKFYSISITHRGEMVYSKAEMEKNGWLVELGMGR